MADSLKFLTRVKFAILDDLLPSMELASNSTLPYEYSVMTPDYKWHYYQAFDTADGIRYRPVTSTGKVIDGE